MIVKSHAKINCHLGVLGKLKNIHKIETLVFFLSLHDEICIKPSTKKKHEIKFIGRFSKNINKNNTIINLLNLLDEKNLLKNKKYFIKIKKNIPLKSGMGGGSMNAATLLNYFIKFRKINVDNKTINYICKKIGSDVILGLSNKPTILKTDGKVYRINKKINLPIVLIKPKFGCNSGIIYRKVKSFSKSILKPKKVSYLSIKDIKKFRNDLEILVLNKHPKLKNVKKTLNNLPNIVVSRMTGSGSTFVGYFLNKNHALHGTKILKKKYKNYWCILTKTI